METTLTRRSLFQWAAGLVGVLAFGRAKAEPKWETVLDEVPSRAKFKLQTSDDRGVTWETVLDDRTSDACRAGNVEAIMADERAVMAPDRDSHITGRMRIDFVSLTKNPVNPKASVVT